MTAPVDLLRSVDRVLRPRGHVFYGWWIVAAGGGIQLLAAALWMQSYGAFTVLLEAEFGWSKAALAGAFALTRIESGLLGPLQGWVVDRYGPRQILRIGTVLFGLGLIGFSQIDSLFGFYAMFIVIALGSSLGGFTTVIVSLVNWFDRHRAKAVAISQVGYSFGGICVPIVVLSLEVYGWRTTAFASGFIVLAVGLPLAQVVRHRPEDHGEEVDGGSPRAAGSDPDTDAPPREVDRSADLTAREAMRTPAFWLISSGHAFALLTVSAVMVHLVPHLIEDLDYSLTAAGGIVALMTAFMMAGQLCGGWLGDRFDKRIICTLCMGAHAVGLVTLAFASGAAEVVAFALLHGLAWGIRGPLMVALRADYFGASSFGTIMGFSSLIVMLGMSGGPIVSGILADRTGDYVTGLATLGGCALFGAVCFFLARPPRRRERTA